MSLVALRRRLLGRISVDWHDPDGGRMVGGELHAAPGAPTIALTMSVGGGQFHYVVVHEGCVSSGVRTVSNQWISQWVGVALSSDGVWIVEAARGRALLELGDARMAFRRRGLTTVVASRPSDTAQSPVAVFRSVPRPAARSSFIEIDPAVSSEELAILAVAMASGTVLLLRPLARLALMYWQFSWQRPALTPARRREQWAADVAPRDAQ